MEFWIASAVGVTVAYLLGATPTAYLAGKWLQGIDIREYGSKSVGATNALRVLGKGAAAAVLAIDVLKGVAAIGFTLWFVPRFLSGDAATSQGGVPWVACLAGLAAMLGHSRSVWLKFTGGKSAATGLGVLLALLWPVDLGTAAVFGVLVAAFRIVSLGSMLAAVTAMGLALSLDLPLPYRLLVIVAGLYVIYLHRANIQRLRVGTEPRLGQSSPDGG